jgi:hypothetical protein
MASPSKREGWEVVRRGSLLASPCARRTVTMLVGTTRP